MIAALQWLGGQARIVLALGCCLAIFLPTLSAWLRPYLPALVSMVLALAMARIDLVGVARGAVQPRRLGRSLLLVMVLMPGLAVGLWLVAWGLGLAPADRTAITYFALAPPIASAAGLAFLMGANAALALEITLLATVLSPIIGPLMAVLLLPEAPGPGALALAARLSAMIAGGLAAALLLRALFGAERIARNGQIVDGLAALGMFLFVIPLFDGIGALVLAAPVEALRIFALAVALNLGLHLVARRLARSVVSIPDARAVGITTGNRTVALYLAALPPEPTFALFVALYQFPMYFTPLILGPRRLR
ncbi:MAG: hypothetical protein AAGE18_05800 [Pseudomonadota bacterium]